MRDIDKRFLGIHALSRASLEVAAGGDHGARRPERGGKVDPDQGAHRRLRPGRRLHRVCGPADRFRISPGSAARRHQHDLSGDQPRPLSFGGREHLSRTRIPALWPARLGPHECGSRRSAAALRGRHRRAPPADGFFDRDPADGRDRPRRFVQGAARDHGRADLLARRTRGVGSVRRDAPAARRRRRRHFHHPSARRTLSGLRPGHGHARRTHRDDEPHGRHRQAPPHLGHAGAGPRDRAQPRDRLFRDLRQDGGRSAVRRGPARSAARCARPGSR